MHTIQTDKYSILFSEAGYSYLSDILNPQRYSRIFILTDTNTSQLCLPNFLANLATEIEIEIIEIEAGEINKNIETCTGVWQTLSELNADRKSIIINLGGGMVTDLGGFVASTFKRGIDFINVPTTLLAMVDASVGGKTGVDLDSLKNQIGIINTPVSVIVDISFLDTLPANEMRSGLAEMLKHGLIADNEYWKQVINLNNLTTDDLISLVYQSIQIKNHIVLQDPTEKGVRKLLNFGHTLGHAVESYHLENLNKTTLLHGEAIAVGMILESHISLQKGFITIDEFKEIRSIISSFFNSIHFDESDIDNIINFLQHDKKNEFGIVQFTLLTGIGTAVFNQQVEKSLIIKAFKGYLD